MVETWTWALRPEMQPFITLGHPQCTGPATTRCMNQFCPQGLAVYEQVSSMSCVEIREGLGMEGTLWRGTLVWVQ